MEQTTCEVIHNILYLNRVSEIGGAEISLLLLLERLDKALFNPIVVLPCPGPLVDRLTRLGIETVLMPLNTLRRRNPWPYIRTVYQLVRLIKSREIDLVHINIEFSYQYGAVAARLAGVPCVGHIRNLWNKWNLWERLLSNPNVLIANSRAVAQNFQVHAWRQQRIEVIYNGVDLEVFDPASVDGWRLRERLNILPKTFLIGVVGRIAPEKGQHVFLESLAMIVPAHPETHALIVGDARIARVDGCEWYWEYLHERVTTLGLEERVTFTGFLEEVVHAYAALDVIVLPSVAEPFGRTLIEAMAMAKPVIATRAGGTVEVVEDGVTGLLVSSGDAEELASVISQFANDKSMAMRMGEKGRERVKRLFDIRENVRKIEEIYKSMWKYPNVTSD